jgi:ferric-dicitrate binding protein FerR (iron transport regulator)
MTKRAAAIANGAIPITLRQCSSMNFRRKATGQLGKPEDAEAWHRDWLAARRAALAEKSKEVQAAFDRPIETK